jgi:hypothetical protein
MDAIRNRGAEGRDGFVRLNAGMVEGAVLRELRKLLRTPEVTAASKEDPASDNNAVVSSLLSLMACGSSCSRPSRRASPGC